MRGVDFVPENGRDPSRFCTLTETNEAFMTADGWPVVHARPGSDSGSDRARPTQVRPEVNQNKRLSARPPFF